MKEQIDDFLINSIVFDDEPLKVMKQYKDSESLDKIMELIKDFIITYNDFQSFDDYIANNIYEIIAYIKYQYNYINENQKKVKYEIFNECIRNLNNRLQTNNEEFYMSQFFNRRMDIDYVIDNYANILPEEIKQNIRASLCFDKFFYEILSKEQKNISDSEFSILVMNTMFIYSVNYFKTECPELLYNNIILKNVLIENEKNIINLKSQFQSYNGYEKPNSLKKCSKQLLKEIRW